MNVRGAKTAGAACCFAMVMTFAATLFGAAISAQDRPADGDDPCEVSTLRTNVRPGAGGPPTEVSVGIRLVDLTEIDDVAQMMTGTIAVLSSWTDPRLAYLDGCAVHLDEIWSPDGFFLNAGRTFTKRPREAIVGPGGAAKYLQLFQGSFATYHNLRDFPFDKHVFSLTLFSVEPENEVRLVVNERWTGRREILNISDWQVTDVTGMTNRQYAEAFDRFHWVFELRISGNRFTSYYFMKVILPMCLIVAMSWCVFWVNPARFGPQIGLAATSMLTLIAFMFATTHMLPKLGYFTILDVFITGSIILVFLALAESVTTGYLVSRERAELAIRVDQLARVVFPLVFTGFAGYLLIS